MIDRFTLHRTLIVLGLIGVTVIFAVWAKLATNRDVAKGRITVTYWEKWGGSEAQAMQKVVNEFNNSQNRIFVRYISVSGIDTKTLLATCGGDPPDVAGLWSDQVAQFADQDALTDLTPYAHAAGINASQYIPSYWREVNYKGKLYALPTSPGTSALFVNKALCPPEYNSPATFPKTLSEFAKFVDESSKKFPDGKLKQVGFLPRFGFGSNSWAYLFGGSIVQNGAPKINSAKDIKAWEWVHSFAEKFGLNQTQTFTSGLGPDTLPTNPFATGQLVCLMDGPWMAHFIQEFSPKVQWFAVPMPYPDGHPEMKDYTVLNMNTLMIPKGARHPAEAFQFMAFVQRQDIMEQLCQAQFCNSPLSHISYNFVHNNANPYIDLFDKLAYSPNAVGREHIGIYGQIMSEITNAADSVDDGSSTPTQAFNAGQHRLDGIWKRYQSQFLNP